MSNFVCNIAKETPRDYRVGWVMFTNELRSLPKKTEKEKSGRRESVIG